MTVRHTPCLWMLVFLKKVFLKKAHPSESVLWYHICAFVSRTIRLFNLKCTSQDLASQKSKLKHAYYNGVQHMLSEWKLHCDMKDAQTPCGHSVWNSLWLGDVHGCETPAWSWSHLPLLPLFKTALVHNLLLGGRVLQSPFQVSDLGCPSLEHYGWRAPRAHFGGVVLCGVPWWWMLASHPWGYQAWHNYTGQAHEEKEAWECSLPKQSGNTAKRHCLFWHFICRATVTGSFELEGAVDVFPFPLLIFVSCTTASGAPVPSISLPALPICTPSPRSHVMQACCRRALLLNLEAMNMGAKRKCCSFYFHALR